MLEDVRKDQIASFLLRKSTLTEAQLDTILAEKTDGNLDFKRTLRDKGEVSKGSFARTLGQGRKNIESSLYTMFLLAYLDLASLESFGQFARTSRMLGELRSAGPSREEMLKVIEAMEEFVEGFASGKRKVIL